MYYGNEHRFIYRPAPRPWEGCIDLLNFKRCPNNTQTCAGMEKTNYVYYIDENIPPINGNYTGWSNWTECSKSCEGGTQYRSRNCTNPKPAYGGRNCSWLGPPDETRSCNDQPGPGNYKNSQMNSFHETVCIL